MKNYKLENENLELEIMKLRTEREMHYRDSIAFQKLSISLGCIIVLLVVYVLT